MGSDAHDDRKRNFCLKDTYEIVQDWVGEQSRALVFDYPQAVIKGEPISVDVETISDEIPGLWEKLIHRYIN